MKFFALKKKIYPEITSLIYINPKGKVIHSFPYDKKIKQIDFKNKKYLVEVQSNWNKIVSPKKWQSFIKTWDDNKETEIVAKTISVSDVQTEFGEPSIIISAPVPIYYGEKIPPTVQGLVSITIPLRKLFEKVHSVTIGATGSLFVLDKDGFFLSHRVTNYILNKKLSDLGKDSSLLEIENAMTAGKIDAKQYESKNKQYFISFTPIGVNNWALGVHGTLKDFTNEIDQLTGIIVTILIFSILLAFVVTYFIVKSIVYPIKSLINTIEQMEAGNLKIKADICCNHEVGKLADAFNRMATRLKNSFNKVETINHSLENKVGERTKALITKTNQLENLNKDLENRVKEEVNERMKQSQMLVQQSKLAAMGEMISMIAHQWRQPLSSISTIAGNLKVFLDLDRYDKKQFIELLEKVNGHSQFLSNTINDFRNFFRPVNKKEEIIISEIIDKTLGIIESALEYSHITVKKNYRFKSTIHTYSNELMQVFLNIIKNAHDALASIKTKEPVIEINGYETATHQVIEIKDNAGGIPTDILNKVFEPYFSTKGETKGTGLGLYMSKTIVEDHCKGSLSAYNENAGAVFKIELPIIHISTSTSNKITTEA